MFKRTQRRVDPHVALHVLVSAVAVAVNRKPHSPAYNNVSVTCNQLHRADGSIWVQYFRYILSLCRSLKVTKESLIITAHQSLLLPSGSRRLQQNVACNSLKITMEGVDEFGNEIYFGSHSVKENTISYIVINNYVSAIMK